jgi:hypothetical protein
MFLNTFSLNEGGLCSHNQQAGKNALREGGNPKNSLTVNKSTKADSLVNQNWERLRRLI